METSTIRIAIRKLPDQFDRRRITTVLDEIESALMDDGGVYGRFRRQHDDHHRDSD
ncbi:hypothetical protein [Tateyamaria pelophila]|uniref:hypothetical protein n=1 Tax=Tateyamaria pelophila TaxID=328415 RepID=UPI001CBB2374|nr:hypothetical protein [Tateyamaria pelophila]